MTGWPPSKLHDLPAIYPFLNGWTWVVAAVSLLIAGMTKGEEPMTMHLTLTVENPNHITTLGNCPTEPELKQAVARRLGRSPFTPDAPRHMAAVIWSENDELHGRLRLYDNAEKMTGERNVSTRGTCAELAESLALAIAIAIDPLAQPTKRRLSPSPYPPPTDTAPSLGSPDNPVKKKSETASVRASSRRAPSPPKLTIAVGAFGDIGTAPGVAWGIDGGLGAKWTHTAIALSFRYGFRSSDALNPGKVSVGTADAHLTACYHYVSLMGCAVVTAGAMRGQGEGLSDAKTVYLPIILAGARIGIEHVVWRRAFIRIYAELSGAITHNELREDGTEAVLFETGPLIIAWGFAAGSTFF